MIKLVEDREDGAEDLVTSYASRHLCLALDRPIGLRSLREIVFFLLPFVDKVGVIKIHSCFLKQGYGIIDVILGLGFRVWVDLKFMDTPEAVNDEIQILSDRGVKYISIHLSGGSEMIRAAVEATGNPTQHKFRTIILGITVLTTTSQKMLNEEMRVPGTILEQVLHLVRLGCYNKVKGFVSSGEEALFLRQAHGPGIFIATPGVRMADNHLSHNHKRVVTPEQAIRNGSNLIVMGRGLISGGPAVADKVLAEITKAFTREVS